MRYWIYLNELVQGPFDVTELRHLNAFDSPLWVCPEGHNSWMTAAEDPLLALELKEKPRRGVLRSAESPGYQPEFTYGDPQETFRWDVQIPPAVPVSLNDEPHVTMPFRFGNVVAYAETRPIFTPGAPPPLVPMKPSPKLTPENWRDAWPWFTGFLVTFGLVATLSLWWIDRVSSRSAIAEVSETGVLENASPSITIPVKNARPLNPRAAKNPPAKKKVSRALNTVHTDRNS